MMKKKKITFMITEFLLAALAIFFIGKIFLSEKPEKRVAVIIENSGDEKWNACINGMKQSAELYGLHLIICNADDIENAKEQKSLIDEQLDNNIDAFIIQAAPGYEVKEVIDELSTQKPVIIMENDILTEEIKNDVKADSEYPKIMPDDYQLGQKLGEAIIADSPSGTEGIRVGLVCGLSDTSNTIKRRQGFADAIESAGGSIIWECYRRYSEGIINLPEEGGEADFIAVLDTESLDLLCELEEENKAYPKVYGIGNSMKSVYYLDEGRIESLLMPDSYYMGYECVYEMSKMLKNSMYKAEDKKIDTILIRKEDIYNEEIQKFLFAYQ